MNQTISKQLQTGGLAENKLETQAEVISKAINDKNTETIMSSCGTPQEKSNTGHPQKTQT